MNTTSTPGEEYYTVEEASRWLTCMQPVELRTLQQLGKDCSLICKIRDIDWTLRATPHQSWPSERAYPASIIREVFALNPVTAPYIPK